MIEKYFVHISHRDWEDTDTDHLYIANRQTTDGKRTIYYNKPDHAVLPAIPAATKSN